MIPKIKRKLYEASSELVYKVDFLKHANNLPPLSPEDRCLVEELKREGVAVTSLDALSIPSTPQLLQAATNLLPDLEISDAAAALSSNKRHAFSHSIAVSAIKIAKEYPELFLWGLEDRILNILENYIGIPVAYHGVNMRRDIVDGQQIGTRFWHVDGEDRTVVKIIIYLSDVNQDCGPFEYIPKSLTPSYKLFKSVNYAISNEQMEKVVSSIHWKACTGRAGTVVFVDTGKVFHHGKVPLLERTAIFFAYTSKRPKRPALCEASSFRKGLPFLIVPLSKRQRNTIWHYRDLPYLDQKD